MSRRIARRRAAAAVLVGCAVAALAGGVRFDSLRLANDTAQYVSVADNLRAGRGLATSIVYYEEHYALGTVPAPQTVFPPGYPVAIALAAATGVSSLTAAFLVDLLAWAASIWLLFSIALARRHSPAVALGCATAFACLALPWVYTQQMLSEPLFIALTLASTRCLVGSWRRSAYGGSLLAGIVAAAAITVRYAGVFFAAAIVLVFAVELVWRRSWRTVIHGVAFAVPVVTTTLILFRRNARLVGDFRGGNANEILKPIGEVLYTALESIGSLAGIGLRFYLAEFVSAIALVLVAALAWYARGHVSMVPGALAVAVRDRVGLLTAVYPLVSILSLLCLERVTSIGLGKRMLLPVVPFLFLFVLEVARTVRLDEWGPRRLARVALVAVALAYLAGQVHVARSETDDPPRAATIVNALAEPMAETSVGDWLRARVSAAHPVLGNEPQMLGAVLERPVVGLTVPDFSSRTWTADEAISLIRAYGVEYVVLIPDSLASSRAESRLPILAELAAGEVPGWLAPVHLSNAVHVYRVREPAAARSDEVP